MKPEGGALLPIAASYLAARDLLSSKAVLVDVGCSGGHVDTFKPLKDNLTVYAYDPLVAEVERLARQAAPGTHYRAAFVGPGPDAPRKPASDVPSNAIQSRTYAAEMKARTRFDNVKEVFNRGDKVVHADRAVSLDADLEGVEVDYLKVDTDGHDYGVLLGAQGILSRRRISAVMVECRMHGRQSDDANLWRNIDRLLCESGLSLFDFRPRRYSRAALPSPFTNSFGRAGATRSGQINWADAVYLRDLGVPDYEQAWGQSYDADTILKTVVAMDQLGFPDAAIEVLETYRERLAGRLDVDHFINVICKTATGRLYPEHLRQMGLWPPREARTA